MQSRRSFSLVATCALLLLAAVGCERSDDEYGPLALSTDPGFSFETGQFQPFLGTDFEALSIATEIVFDGEDALRFDIPGPDTGLYAGGVFVSGLARDLSGYNALSVYMRANRDATFDLLGFGNDNTGTSRFEASRSAIPLSTEWRQVIVPIPNPERLRGERGLATIAESFEGDTTRPYMVWVDEPLYTNVRGLSAPRPTAPINRTIEAFVGTTITLPSRTFVFDYDGRSISVNASAGYLDFEADTPGVVKTANGRVQIVSGGQTTLTGTIRGEPANYTVEVTGIGVPTDAPATPTYPASQVLALFSDQYATVGVDSWSAGFDRSSFPATEDLVLAGNTAKAYTNLGFLESQLAAIDFVSQQIDVSAYEFLRFDLWIASEGLFGLTLVDFGPDGAFQGGDDTRGELGFGFNEGDLPAEQWVTFVVPLSRFQDEAQTITTALTDTPTNLAQILFRGQMSALFIDNILFFNE